MLAATITIDAPHTSKRCSILVAAKSLGGCGESVGAPEIVGEAYSHHGS